MPDPQNEVASTRLSNGVRVITESMPGVASVTLGLWVENGSRYESPAEAGLSHFLEHLYFKGTERRSAARIAEEADAIGGVLNAFTGKEYTCYWAKVLAEHLPVAKDLLADLFLHSRFDPEEIDRERTVVLQEIAQVEDTPDEQVHDLFSLHYWPGHPLSFPICGHPETVSGFQREDFLSFIAARYRPDRLLVAAAGNLRHADLLDWAEREFGSLSGTTPPLVLSPPSPEFGVHVVEKDLEQAHVCLGTPGISHTSEQRYAAWVLNTALGGGMSSRLFQEVREKRGRAYSVYSFLSSYSDSGYLGVYVGTSPEWVPEVVEVSLAELRKLAREGLGGDELERARNQIKGNLLLGLETSDSRMIRVAKNQLYHGFDTSPAALAARIDATTNDEIVALAEALFRPEAMAVTILGDVGEQKLDTSLLSPA